MRYYVLQFSKDQQGGNKTSVYVFDTETAALKSFYSRCAADIDDLTKMNALVMVIDMEGNVLDSKQFVHIPEETIVEPPAETV